MVNFLYSGNYTDQYQLTMAQAHFLAGRTHHQATFDYFFRKNPFGNGFTVFCGIETLLDAIEHWHFSQDDIQFLAQQGFDKDFLNYLKHLTFTGSIEAPHQGEPVFPNEPVVTIQGNIIETQLLETLVLNTLNFQSLIATKANRIRSVAGDAQLVEFGLRRAQGLGGYHASNAAIAGGFDASSNVKVAQTSGSSASGTMSHAFIQSFDSELEAFRTFTKMCPEHSILLVDTYNTINSGIPNAIKIAKEINSSGQTIKGIRLDSGNLEQLSKQARAMLDQAGLYDVKIVASDQLNEYTINNLRQNNAPIDTYGVGTELVTGAPDGALDGVYKISYFNNQPRIKLSETPAKITLPGNKKVYRLYTDSGAFAGIDLITLADEQPDHSCLFSLSSNKPLSVDDNGLFKPLRTTVFDNGLRLTPKQRADTTSIYRREQLRKLPKSYQQLDNSKPYQICLSKNLKALRDTLVNQYRK